MAAPWIIRSKLSAPAQKSGIIYRRALVAWFARMQRHKLSLLTAPPGYGKTTTLSLFAQRHPRTVWYTLSSADEDPSVFLQHLVAAIGTCCVLGEGEDPSAWLQGADLDRALLGIIHAMQSSAGFALVLDDFDCVRDQREVLRLLDSLITYSPQQVIFALASRTRVHLPCIPKLRASGRLLRLDSEIFRFSREDVAQLLRAEGVHLGTGDLETVYELTEGWPLGVRIVAQYLASGATLSDLRAKLAYRGSELYEYLAQEVISKQPSEVVSFMLASSPLPTLEPALLDKVLGRNDSQQMLEDLEERGLFVSRLGEDKLRYHPLVRDYLLRQARAAGARVAEVARRAARYYDTKGEPEHALELWLLGEDYDEIYSMLARWAPRWLREGHYSRLLRAIESIPAPRLEDYPELTYYKARALQAMGKLHTAFELYGEAARRFEEEGDGNWLSRALLGRASIYREKGQISRAGDTYFRVLSLLEPEDISTRAEVVMMLGISDAASGLLGSAERRLRDALELYELGEDADGQFHVWNNLAQVVYLRRGDFPRALEAASKARQIATELGADAYMAGADATLATVLYMQGDYARARQLADANYNLASRLGNQAEAIDALVVRAHTLRYGSDRDKRAAKELYGDVLNRMSILETNRHLAVESLLGLSSLHRLLGDPKGAEGYAQQAATTAERIGHEWFRQVCQLELAAITAMMGHRQEATSKASACLEWFRSCGDRYHQAHSLLLLAYLEGEVEPMLKVVEEGGYWALLSRERYFALPLLVSALGNAGTAEAARRALLAMGSEVLGDAHNWLLGDAADESQQGGMLLGSLIDDAAKSATSASKLRSLAEEALRHMISRPPYTLYIQMLGGFRVLRGDEVVGEREWRSTKTRILLQFLASHRGQMFPKDRLLELLWPEMEPAAADNNFRFSLSILTKVLEPQRPKGAPPYYIVRRNDAYGLDMSADVVVDTEEFEELVRQGKAAYRRGLPGRDEAIELLRKAIDLYKGDYLPESLYDDWTSLERERLRELFFDASTHLCLLLLQNGEYDEVIKLAWRTVEMDPCREESYRLLIRAYAEKGDRIAAIRAYKLCASNLQRELGVDPMPETQEMYNRLRQIGY